MSTSAAQASAFFDEVGRTESVWTVEDDGGVPAPLGADGRRAMPFWSRRSRAERVIGTVPAYSGFRPSEIALRDFVDRWLPGLERDGIDVGLNWSGSRATGYDLTPREVLARLTEQDAGSERRAYTEAFLAHLQHLFTTDTDWNDGTEWVAGRALTDDVAVVLYRDRPGGPVLGRRYDLAADRTLFTDDSAEAIAGEAWTGDFVDPSGPGELLPVDWADGLCDDPGSVQWIGAAQGGTGPGQDDSGAVRRPRWG